MKERASIMDIEFVKALIVILMSGILTENYVLRQFLGICPFLGVSKKFNQATGMGIAVTFVMLCATAVTWPIYTYLLAPGALLPEDIAPGGFEFLKIIVFILVIAALVQFVEIVLKKFIPALHKSLGVYLPLITTNCAVLGVALNNISDGYDFLKSMVASLGVGLGFLLAMILFAGVRSRIENCPSPKSFRGVPITLVAASILALAFFGFSGIVENMLPAAV